jgi:hypothetical protein
VPIGWIVGGESSPNIGTKFRLNLPISCQVMGMSVYHRPWFVTSQQRRLGGGSKRPMAVEVERRRQCGWLRGDPPATMGSILAKFARQLWSYGRQCRRLGGGADLFISLWGVVEKAFATVPFTTTFLSIETGRTVRVRQGLTNGSLR